MQTPSTPSTHPSVLLGPKDLIRRWQAGSPATLWRAEQDGLLIPRRIGRRKGYDWRAIWAYEGGQPPHGMEAAYRRPLLTPEDVAQLFPLKASTIVTKAKSGLLPCRKIGSRIRFVPTEIQRFLEAWA